MGFVSVDGVAVIAAGGSPQSKMGLGGVEFGFDCLVGLDRVTSALLVKFNLLTV